MSAESVPTAWWIYLLAGFVTVTFTAIVVGVLVIAQRRQMAQARRFSRGLVEAQEAERARIARELHDDIIQRVALIGGEVSALSRMLSAPEPGVAQRIEGIREELGDLAEQVRSMARRAHPATLDHLGLARAVQALAADMSVSAGLEVAVEIDPTLELDGLPSQASLSLYRVAQEGLRNVARHAGIDAATLRLGRRDGGVFMAVEDRGAGIDQAARNGSGLGLLGLRERMRAVQGELVVDTEPGRGTRLVAWAPFGGPTG